MENKGHIFPNPIMPNQCIIINPDLCNGCNSCVKVCRTDVLIPNKEKGKPPILVYPDECWFCGCCVEECPIPDVISLNFPLNQRVVWKRKETGEYFRIGMKNPPPPNTKPPLG